MGEPKTERRLLKPVQDSVDKLLGAITVQKADTIGLVSADGRLSTITELKGSKILCNISRAKGRHFGMAVEEAIVEKCEKSIYVYMSTFT